MHKYIILFLLIVNSLIVSSQNNEIAVGNWIDNLPYRNLKQVIEIDDKIYAATQYGIFYFDKTYNSITRLSKVQGLSDVGISDINYNKKTKTLVVTYLNANIDLIKDNKVINVSDIKRSQIIGNKTIYKVKFIDDKAFLSCGFGIVVLDLIKNHFPEPVYTIANSSEPISVFDLTYNPNDSLIYAATNQGVFKANRYAKHLANTDNWSKETSPNLPSGNYSLIEYFNNKIYTNLSINGYANDKMFVKENTTWSAFELEVEADRKSLNVCNNKLLICLNLAIDVYDTVKQERDYRIYNYYPGTVSPNDAIIDKNGNHWIADENSCLAMVKSNYFAPAEFIVPNGPNFSESFTLNILGKKLCVARGGYDFSDFSPQYKWAEVAIYEDNKWFNINKETDTLLSKYRDITCAVADPKDPKRVYAGTWNHGLFEFYDNKLVNIYNETNSSIETSAGSQLKYIRIGGIAFDDHGNLWISNSGAINNLAVRKTDGAWNSFKVSNSSSDILSKVVIDKLGQKWIIMKTNNLIVFNDNGTIDNKSDDKVKKLSNAQGNGGWGDNKLRVFSIVADRDKYVWIGTDAGVRVFYTPDRIFSDGNFDAQPITINAHPHVYHLLSTETVTTIAVDGANKKWFGTERSGIYYTSADGQRLIYHFTAENSPLLSNNISDIVIDKDGIVYVGTEKGIIAFKNDAVEPNVNFSELEIYPNPVKSTYYGNISIKGLTEKAIVKITDIAGDVVFNTKSEGGLTTWDGKNFNGVRVSTGVYLVFVTSEDGSLTKTSKIVFIN